MVYSEFSPQLQMTEILLFYIADWFVNSRGPYMGTEMYMYLQLFS